MTPVNSDQIDAVVGKIGRDLDAGIFENAEQAIRRAVEAGVRLSAAPRVAGLTRAQFDLLTFIRGYAEDKGYPPSFDEMCEAMGLASKSGVHRLLVALEERGAIRRLPHRARAIEIVAA